MTNSAGHYVYKAFGLTIKSEILLPEVPQSKQFEDVKDVVIERADLTSMWAELSEENERFAIKDDICMFKVDRVAIYFIQGGNKIIVSPLEGANEDQIRLFILGTSMGALLMQRKVLPLHGTALFMEGKAFAIMGSSGAGKSTLASAFLKKGYQLISDDLIPITFNEDGIPFVTSAYPQQKLWQASLNQYGMDVEHYRPLIDRATKFAIPVVDQFAAGRFPLAGVFELTKTMDDEIEMYPIQKLDRLHTLFRHTFRKSILARSGLLEWHFRTVTKMANKIDLFHLRRPASRFTAYDLADLIETKLFKGGKGNEKKPKSYVESIG
ncbi:aldolase [Lentibacillus sp. Marseille-P4043]|uniref:aldolase n=1 Tax=Lentibacillus sp. Marseille-P4043 TaxID=2040293 RepID=UPI000D0B9707|nr:aldolase [Lentibacillus sp. Marseille-P4043]